MSASKSNRGRAWFRRVNAPLLTAAFATLLSALLYIGHQSKIWTVPGLEDWERSTADIRFRMRGQQAPLDDRIVIVAMDGQTRSKLPELWQTRRGYAQLIDKVYKAKPRAIGIDAFFSSPEINLSQESVLAVRNALNALSAEDTPSPASEIASLALQKVDRETRGDATLAEAVKASQSALVLALLFQLGDTALQNNPEEAKGLSGARFDEFVDIDQPDGRRVPEANGAYLPLPIIAEAITHMGHVNIKHDSDGVVREAPFVIKQAGRFYQNLALKMASMELRKPTSYAAGDDFVSIGKKRIHLNPQGVGLISYLGGNKTFARISAYDVMSKEGPHPGLLDKLVLIGYTDAARDKLITPFERQLDGIELHATLIHNILHGQLLTRVNPWYSVLALLIIGSFIALLQLRSIRKRGAWVVGIGALLAVGCYWLLAQYLFGSKQLQIELVAPTLGAVFVTLTAMTASLATEGREKAELRSAFGQYLQSTLVERILRDPERLRLGGQRRELTVLFSDIRSFSKFSEALEPEALSDFLNEYLTPMTDLVMEDSGMLDKYIGDAVMAVYGAPIYLDDHAMRACGTALAMRSALGPLNASWASRDLPKIAIGIGINTGPMSVGNMGSEKRFDYTVMGDAVNLGARLESLTKAYKVNILVGKATRDAAKERFAFREIDGVRVIGRSAAARVYELCGTHETSPFTEADLALFQSALEAYRAMDWQQAETLYAKFAQSHPEDGPTQTMRDRIPVLRAQSLDDDWDGIFDQASK